MDSNADPIQSSNKGVIEPFRIFISSRQDVELNRYREWATSEASHFSDLLTVWRFEDAPAAAQQPPDIFLPGVDVSDCILYIAGSDITEATASEINRAIELNKDMLCIILPADNRSGRVTELIGRIRARATTRNVEPDEVSFRAAVRESIRSWILIRMYRGESQVRKAKLETEMRTSMIRIEQSLLAAGVEPALAPEIARDQSLWDANTVRAANESAGFKIIVGPKGSGKTFALEHLYQSSITTSQSDVLAPVPVFLSAFDISRSLRESVESQMLDLGSLELNGAALFLDALDEIDEARAERLMQEAMVLQRSFQRSRAILASRHFPPKHFQDYVVRMPALDVQNARALAGRVGGTEALSLFRGGSEAVSEAILRPLFTIVSAQRPTHSLNDQSVADFLISRALSRTEQASISTTVLQRLAVGILDSPDASLPKNQFSPAEQQALLESRLAVERSESFRIPLRIVTERAASIWLSSQPPSIALGKAKGSEDRVDRWMSALDDYTRSLSDDASENFVLEVAQSDIVLALTLAELDENALAALRQHEIQSEYLRRAESIFESAFPKLYELYPSKISISPGAYGYFDVTRQQLDDAGIVHTTTTYYGAIQPVRHAALRFVKRSIVDIIDANIKKRTFAVPDERLRDEDLWNQARALIGRGTLSHDPLPVDQILERLDLFPDEEMFIADSGAHYLKINPKELRAHLNGLKAKGIAIYTPPFITGDKQFDKWVWSNYSQDQLLEKRRDVISVSLRVYETFVTTFFPGLANRLQLSLLMPLIYKEHLQYDGMNQPLYSQYCLPLPGGVPNQIDIEYGNEFDFRDIAVEMRLAVDELRTGARQRIRITSSWGRLQMWSAWPIREQVYKWIQADLKAIGYSKEINTGDLG